MSHTLGVAVSFITASDSMALGKRKRNRRGLVCARRFEETWVHICIAV